MKPDTRGEIGSDVQRVCAGVRQALSNPPPWLHPFHSVVERVSRTDADSIAESLNLARGPDESHPRFVSHAMLPAGEAYETFIARTFCIPTRDDLHDLFNGMVWLAFPKTKRRMNLLQAQEIARDGVSGSRGPVRDALTVFDENGALMQAPPLLIDALRERDWNTLFVTHRAAWASTRLVLFGHALLEKLLQPRKPITAHVWCVDELSDDAVAAGLTAERMSGKPFLPLPVLGVPGWCQANEDPLFYRDTAVFRLPSPQPG